MLKNKFILSMGSLLFLGNSLCLDVSASENNQKHPIEKSTKACLDKSRSTMEMVNCNNKAYKKWDKELNRVYRALMRKLKNNRKAQNALRKAQRAWNKYKNAELKNITLIYDSLQGTMWIPVEALARVEITKKRALTLKSYLDNLQIGSH